MQQKLSKLCALLCTGSVAHNCQRHAKCHWMCSSWFIGNSVSGCTDTHAAHQLSRLFINKAHYALSQHIAHQLSTLHIHCASTQHIAHNSHWNVCLSIFFFCDIATQIHSGHICQVPPQRATLWKNCAISRNNTKWRPECKHTHIHKHVHAHTHTHAIVFATQTHTCHMLEISPQNYAIFAAYIKPDGS
jgi:hypothetical protein